jgi:hypothetical protein
MPGTRNCESGADNDCNGAPDNAEAAYCRCNPSASSRSCDPYDRGGKGICELGTETCVLDNDGSTSDWVCTGAVAPDTEMCDEANLDEDCDGDINEGCFVAKPCITSTSGTDAEILARGNDGGIYYRIIEETETNTWVTTNLTDAGLDTLSNLDCVTNVNGIHIVARGNSPVGSAL